MIANPTGASELHALNARLEKSMAQIERCEEIPGDRNLDVLSERRAARKPHS